jgi:hypothetical protein
MRSMRLIPFVAFCWGSTALSQDAREIVRKSVELDQANWARRADYTWNEEDRERHFDSHNRMTAEHQEAWETLVLDGEPYRRMLQRDFKPIPEDEQKKGQRSVKRSDSGNGSSCWKCRMHSTFTWTGWRRLTARTCG